MNQNLCLSSEPSVMVGWSVFTAGWTIRLVLIEFGDNGCRTSVGSSLCGFKRDTWKARWIFKVTSNLIL